MAPRSLLHPLSSVCFKDKIQFSASQHLSYARSNCFRLPEIESHNDVWSIKPPDFSLRLYRSLSVPQKKERKTHSNLSLPELSERKRRAGLFLPNVLHESYEKEAPPNFITSYRPPDALEYELMFVKTGKFSSGPYKNPKPHNFRPWSAAVCNLAGVSPGCRAIHNPLHLQPTKNVQRQHFHLATELDKHRLNTRKESRLEEDLPDIVTTYKRDPGNLNLKLKHLDVIQTTTSEPDFSSRDTKTKMDTYKPKEPTWDVRLILPQPPWPPKSASFTRHQQRRGAYSAFLDRVEEKLSRSWKNRS